MAGLFLLTNCPLDKSYSSIVQLDSFDKKLTFFNDKCNVDITDEANYTGVNFPKTDLVNTSFNVGFKTGDTDKYGIASSLFTQTIFNVRYAIVKYTDEYRFYFVNEVYQGTNNTYRLSLELDVFTTYGEEIFKSSNYTTKLETVRKHCDRFEVGVDNFLIKTNNEVVLGDVLDGRFKARKIKNYTRHLIKYHTNDLEEVNGIGNFNQKINGYWAYFYFSDELGAGYSAPQNGKLSYKTDSGLIPTGLLCFAVPLSETFSFHLTGGYGQVPCNFTTFYEYLKSNPSLVSIKITAVAPFPKNVDYNAGGNLTNYLSKITFDTSFDTSIPTSMYKQVLSGNNDVLGVVMDLSGGAVYLPCFRVYTIDIREQIVLDTIYPFGEYDKDTIHVNDIKKSEYEPKLYTTPYSYYCLKTIFGQEYGYNKVLMGYEGELKLVNTPNAQQEKYMYYYVSENSELPYNELWKIGIGSIGLNDYNINTFSNAYADYMANHSNALITGLAVPVAQSVAQGIIGSASSGSGVPLISSIVSGTASAVDFIAKMDDLQKTPDQVRLSGNDFVHDLSRNGEETYVTYELELLDIEKRQVLDFYFKYGWAVNQEYSISEMLGRLRFNFIKLSENEFFKKFKGYAIPKLCVDRVNDVFNTGVIVWKYYANPSISTVQAFMNDKVFNYEYENYENGLLATLIANGL